MPPTLRNLPESLRSARYFWPSTRKEISRRSPHTAVSLNCSSSAVHQNFLSPLFLWFFSSREVNIDPYLIIFESPYFPLFVERLQSLADAKLSTVPLGFLSSFFVSPHSPFPFYFLASALVFWSYPFSHIPIYFLPPASTSPHQL